MTSLMDALDQMLVNLRMERIEARGEPCPDPSSCRFECYCGIPNQDHPEFPPPSFVACIRCYREKEYS